MSASAIKAVAPGIYADMPPEVYHADPSLSASGIHKLVDECPALFQYERTHRIEKRCFDIGTGGHLMILEPESFADRIHIIPADDYKTKAAREERDQAYRDGLTPLLSHERDMLSGMRLALHNDSIAKHAFAAGGLVEQSVFWTDPAFGIPCRTRPDFLSANGRYLINYKTAASAAPAAVQRALMEHGWHQRAAWEMDGMEAIGRPVDAFAFVVQAKKAPYLVSVHWLESVSLHRGRQENMRGKAIFAQCMATGEWPSYRPDPLGKASAFTTGLPFWALKEYERREEAGEFDFEPQQREAA